MSCSGCFAVAQPSHIGRPDLYFQNCFGTKCGCNAQLSTSLYNVAACMWHTVAASVLACKMDVLCANCTTAALVAPCKRLCLIGQVAAIAMLITMLVDRMPVCMFGTCLSIARFSPPLPVTKGSICFHLNVLVHPSSHVRICPGIPALARSGNFLPHSKRHTVSS